MDKVGAVSHQDIGFEKKFKIPEKLLKFEERMKEKEEHYLKQFHGVGNSNMQTD